MSVSDAAKVRAEGAFKLFALVIRLIEKRPPAVPRLPSEYGFSVSVA